MSHMMDFTVVVVIVVVPSVVVVKNHHTHWGRKRIERLRA